MVRVIPRHLSNVRHIPELLTAVEIGLDERRAVWFVLLYDVVLVAVEPAGVKSERLPPQHVCCVRSVQT